MRRSLVVCALAFAAGACGLDAVGTFVAGTDEPKPPVTSDDASTPGNDASKPDEPVTMDPVAACGRPSVYVDEFADGVIGPEWIAALGSGSIVESGGQLSIAHGIAGPTRLTSRYAVNLHDDRIRVRVPFIDPATEAYVGATSDATHEIAMIKEGALLTLRTRNGGAPSSIELTYDPVLHSWWQILEEGGSIRFETSPDGRTWTTHASTPTPDFVSVVRMTFVARPVAGAAGRFDIDRLNVGRPPTTWCKADSFKDDFADTVTAPEWRVIAAGACTWTEIGGAFHVTLTGSGAARCAYESETAYDLRASSVKIEVPAITETEPQVRHTLRITHATGAIAEIGLLGTTTFLQTATAAVPPTTTTTYGGVDEDFWRLREASGQLIWESSADGTTWVVKRSVAAPFPLDAVRVSFGSIASGAMARPIGIGTPGYN